MFLHCLANNMLVSLRQTIAVPDQELPSTEFLSDESASDPLPAEGLTAIPLNSCCAAVSRPLHVSDRQVSQNAVVTRVWRPSVDRTAGSETHAEHLNSTVLALTGIKRRRRFNRRRQADPH